MRKYYIKFGIITVLLISLIVFSIVYFFKVPKCPKDTNFKCFTEGFTNIKIKNPESALKVIEGNVKTMGIDDINEEFYDCKKSMVQDNTYYRFKQQYKGIPVYGRNLVVCADQNFNGILLTGNYQNIDGIQTTPAISEKEAERAINERGKSKVIESKGLTIYSLFNIEPVLTWEFVVNTNENIEIFLVSAMDGVIIDILPVMDSVYEEYQTDGNGYMSQITLNGQMGIKELEVYEENGYYNLFDIKRKIEIYRMKRKNLIGFIPTNMNSGDTEIIRWKIGSDLQESKTEVDSLGNIQTVYDLYERRLDHRSTDGRGKATIFLFTRFGDFKNGKGEKDSLIDNASSISGINEGKPYTAIQIGMIGNNNRSMAAYLDVVAHEYTHAVINYTCGLVNIGESGCINEGICDIFGEIIEYWDQGSCDWIMCPKEDGSRNIANPYQTGNPLERDRDYWEDPEDMEKDNGNVHNNSTVVSHSAYLMWKGINGGDEFEPLNIDELAQLYYMTLYVIPTDCTLGQFRTLLENTAYIMCQQGKLTNKQRLCVSNAMFQCGIRPEIVSYEIASDFDFSVYDLNGNSYSDYSVSFSEVDRGMQNSKRKEYKEKSIVFTAPNTEAIQVSLPLDWEFCNVVITDDKNPQRNMELYLEIRKDGRRELKISTFFGDPETELDLEGVYLKFLEGGLFREFVSGWIYGEPQKYAILDLNQDGYEELLISGSDGSGFYNFLVFSYDKLNKQIFPLFAEQGILQYYGKLEYSNKYKALVFNPFNNPVYYDDYEFWVVNDNSLKSEFILSYTIDSGDDVIDNTDLVMHTITNQEGSEQITEGEWCEYFDDVQIIQWSYINQGEAIRRILEPVLVNHLVDEKNNQNIFNRFDVPKDDLQFYLSFLLNHEMYEGESILFGNCKDGLFEKNIVYRIFEEIYGNYIPEEKLLNDDFFIITNDQIGVYGADGDGIPEIMIKESESEDDILKVNFSYEMLYTVDEFNYVGSGTAVFSRNPSGLFGYTLENVFLDK